ncbi:M20/M25/M40 family metallo-hydrolase [Caulobacter sp. 17J65-9]|uniref:M20/M25/M40 family metallo-hydrolase n=1 Tax=Caulobacter sp. 17J65-9 TaxID=2709382 RepID=UPI0013C5F8A3|nr:M20/M25/M40 family metallo-hydrolase [Caulobacter sp. 17J65-9]NEX91637.1 M20/M25/M40 family metallo-hydrolase [Caulobacter sp. 17J65-9]
MKFWMKAAVATAALMLPAAANAQAPRADQQAFRGLYKEMVEIDSSQPNGSCTAVAQAMSARLKAAGFADADLNVVTHPDHPKEGNLVAVLHGTDAKAKPMLLLAHIDVVAAKREDWTRDPFALIEENGWFYGRGTSDDKAQAAIWTDSLIRMKQEGFKPKRDIKMALTCGEENGAYNGISHLIAEYRPLIDAGFALNEGAGGLLDANDKPVSLEVQSGEKVYQDFQLVSTNPGGHSSRPVKDNAIYHLSAALSNIGAYEFPIRFNDTTRGYFTRMAPLVDPKAGAAMKALVADPANADALAEVTKDPMWNSMLRTTCVATLVNAGHAPNALPQRATANVNCRILPGTQVEEVRKTLEQVAGDPKVSVAVNGPISPVGPAPVLTPEMMKPLEREAAKLWPNVPIVPIMQTGATDGKYLIAAGIPTYGVEGLFTSSDGDGIHGLNERVRVKSLYDARDFLYALVKDYAVSK